jgi:spore germination protein YaaH
MNKMKKTIMLALSFSLVFSLFSVSKSEAKSEKLSMTYLYGGNSDQYITQVERTNGAVDIVTPNYFDLNDDGSLKVTNKFNQTFVHKMKERDIKVVPFLSNHWDRETGRKALENQKQLVNDIVSFTKQHKLDGINVDFEGLNEQDRDSFTDFIRLLREEMPKDKNVSVAVAANPKGYTKGWHGSYDYTNLAKYADFLMIMAYDESWYGSLPGAVASLSFSEASIQYALRQQVPNGKIVLGVPFYGRVWRLEDIPKDNGAIRPNSILGNGVSLHKVPALTNTYQAKIEYDSIRQSPKATFEIKQGDPEIKLQEWSASPLQPGNYVLWYENDRSLKEKMNLIHKYDLKGVGSWSLGQENVSMWDKYELWVNGLDFKDVSYNHWAQYDIAKANENGWIFGRTETQFFPEGSLKRSEAAAILVRILGLTKQGDSAPRFADVSPNYWGKEVIEIAYENNLMVGKKEGYFSPESSITREEIAVILQRLLNGKSIPSEGKIVNFRDVGENRWSYPSITEMSAKQMFSGFEDGTFRPEEPVTRAQIAVLLNRISPYLN